MEDGIMYHNAELSLHTLKTHFNSLNLKRQAQFSMSRIQNKRLQQKKSTERLPSLPELPTSDDHNASFYKQLRQKVGRYDTPHLLPGRFLRICNCFSI